MAIIAIIDLGSNSVRMTVSEYHQDGSYRVLARRQEMVRLSKKMGTHKILQPEAIARTMKALKSFKTTLKDYPKAQVVAVATAAVRQASNQAEFLSCFKEELEMDLRVLTGEEEAYYDYVGIVNTLQVPNALILDTGGASAELVLVRQNQAAHVISLPVGAVSISEAYLEKDMVSAAGLFQASLALRQLFNDVSWLADAKRLPIIALGGSNRTLAKISRRQGQDIDLPIHGYHLSSQDAAKIYHSILSKGLEARKQVPGLAKERADIIVGGLLPLIELSLRLVSQQVIFSQSGLREGILFETIQQQTGHQVVSPEPAAMTVDVDE